MTKTLFQTGNDLSDDFMSICYRALKGNTFDVYRMIDDSDVSINHRAKRGPSEFVGYSESGNAQYIAGIAYDSFDVWVNVQDADSTTGRPGCSKCIAEDVRSFDEAIGIAQDYIQDVKFEEEYYESDDDCALEEYSLECAFGPQ